MRRSLLLAIITMAMLVPSLASEPAEDEDDFSESSERTPCWPSQGMLIKRANEGCEGYARRVCSEALHADELQKCSLEKCVEETKKRCPFRDLTRARANNFIKAIAVPGNIWDESDADHFCKTWYGDEISNVTRMGAVWDALYMLPCPNTESAIRRMKTCYTIETSNVAALHPMAQFCYSSYPIDLGIGQSVSTQCCYGSDLKLLVLGQKGAGAVDFASKLANHEMSESDHFENDLFPNMACCQLSDNCVKFSAMRPPSVRPETDEEAQASCGAMNSKYSWKPYGKYQPPYARSSEIMTWKEMQLTSESLVPTKKLSELLVASQKVRDAVEKGNNPYESEQAPSAKPSQKPDGKPDESEQHEEKPTAKPTEKPLVPPEKPTHHDEETPQEKPQEKPQHHEEQSQQEEKPMHHDEESQLHGEQKPQLHEETPSHHEEEKPQLHEEKPTHHEEQMPQNHEEEKPSHHEETPSHLEEEKPQHHEEKPQHDDEHDEAQPQHHEEEPQHHEEPSHLKRSSEKVNKKAASKEKGFAKDFGTKKTDRDLDAAIEAVLKGQTKKASKSTGKSKAKHVEASKESNSQHVEKHSDENQERHERNAERRRRSRHQGSN